MAARKYSKKKTSKRKSVKGKRTGGALTSKAAVLRTAYARAVLNPRSGPLVGVPQFVPIATHVVRCRAVGDFHDRSGNFSLLFNPMAMVANDARPIQVFNGTSTVNDIAIDADMPAIGANGLPGAGNMFANYDSNVDYSTSTFSAEGLKARVVGAVIRLCNTSNSHTRDGVFTALHERHHHSLEGSNTTAMAQQNNSIIKPAGDGSWIGLLYRPVRPTEIEDWQLAPGVLPGDELAHTGDNDGAYNDMNPGYMRINWTGTAPSTAGGNASTPIFGQSFHVEAYAIIEYAGESVTTLVKHTNRGPGAANASMSGDIAEGARNAEQGGRGTHLEEVSEKIESIKHNILSHLESVYEEEGDPEASRVAGAGGGSMLIQWAKKQPATATSVHDLASVESAEVSNLAYVAHKTGGSVEAMHETLASAPEHLSHMRDWEVKFVGNGNKDIILHDPATGRIHVGYAGTTGANVGDAGVQWLANNPTLAAGAEFTPRAAGAQRTADIAVEMAGNDVRMVKLHGHSQGGALAIRNAQRTGVPAHVQNPLIPAKDVMDVTKTKITIDRVHGDVVSWNHKFIDGSKSFNAHRVSSSGKVVVNKVGMKGNYSKMWEVTRPRETSAALNCHALDNFRYTDDEVLGVGAKGVQVSRYGKLATMGKVAGEVYTGVVIAGEAVKDWHETKHSNLRVAKAAGLIATDATAEIADVVTVSEASVAGAAAGSAAGEAVGMLVGEAVGAVAGPIGFWAAGAAGAFLGYEATTAIDFARKNIKHFWKHLF